MVLALAAIATAWSDTEPFTNPDAPPGPGYLPEYHNPQIEQANQPNEKAATMAFGLFAYGLYDGVTLPRI